MEYAFFPPILRASEIKSLTLLLGKRHLLLPLEQVRIYRHLKVTNVQFNDITMDSVELVICIMRIYHMYHLVRKVGLEPTPHKRPVPKTGASAIPPFTHMSDFTLVMGLKIAKTRCSFLSRLKLQKNF